MKKVIVAMAIAIPFAVNAADFTGPSIWLGGQYIDGSSEWSDSASGQTAKFGDSDYGVSFGADYGLSLDSNFKVLLGATWNDTAKLGEVNIPTALYAEAESDPSYEIYIAPGFKVNDSTLAFIKTSMTKAKGKLNFDGYQLSDDDTAFGFGFGLRSYITDNVFFNSEVERTEFKYNIGTTQIKTPVTRATLALGMTF